MLVAKETALAQLAGNAQELWRAGAYDEALEALNELCAVEPLPNALQTKATLHRKLCQTEAAIAALDESLAVEPDDAVRIRRALVLPPIVQSTAEIDAVRDRVEADLAALEQRDLHVADPLSSLRSLDFHLAYHGRDDRAIRERLARVLRRACPLLSFTAPHCEAWTGPFARPRIGFFSSHLRDHTIGRLNAGLLTGIERSRFQVVAIVDEHPADEISARIATSVEHCIVIPRELRGAQRAIAALELDALYYTDIGMDPLSYWLAFARLAPIQCATWGHPVTTGIDTIDWFVSGREIEVDDADAHYSESLARLTDPTVCFARPAPVRRERVDLGLPVHGRLYVCPQSPFKLHPDFDPIVGEILRRDDAARLVLLEPPHAEWSQILLTRLAARGPGLADRVHFVPTLERDDYLGLLGAADVVLDPLHFGGGHSTLEALAVGAPVVTLPSRYLRGRLSRAWYRVLGVDDCVVADAAGYVQTALHLARDADARRAVSAKILARCDRLFDQPSAVAAHQEFFADALAQPRHH